MEVGVVVVVIVVVVVVEVVVVAVVAEAVLVVMHSPVFFPKPLPISPVLAVAYTWFLCRPAE